MYCKISRAVWPDLVNHKLNTMAAYLGVEFKHHYALDDAETCAKVAIEAARLKGANSLPELLSKIGVPLEPFIDEKIKPHKQNYIRNQNQSRCPFSKDVLGYDGN